MVGRVRGGLVVSQVAVSLVSLVGAGLMARSLVKLAEVDLGFEPGNVLTLRVSYDDERFPEAQERWKLLKHDSQG